MGKKNDIEKLPLMEQIYYNQSIQKATNNTIYSYISIVISMGFLFLAVFTSFISSIGSLVSFIGCVFSLFAAFFLNILSISQKIKINKKVSERAKELKKLENDLEKRLNKLNKKGGKK